MIPEGKIIELIKKYRVESNRQWEPDRGYDNEFSHGLGIACDRHADDLEELLKSDTEGGKT